MDVLLDQLKKLIVKEGEFILRGGIKSQYYLDMRAAYGSSSTLNALADKLWGATSKNATCIAGYGMGGLPLATAIASRHNLKLCILREKPKAYGAAKQIDGHIPVAEDKLLVVDDVYTTGSTLDDATRILTSAGISVHEYAVIVLRTINPKHQVKHIYTGQQLGII